MPPLSESIRASLYPTPPAHSSWQQPPDTNREGEQLSEPSLILQDTPPTVPTSAEPLPLTSPTGPSSSQARALPPIPPKLLQRITRGEFIDFELLLHENMLGNTSAHRPAITLRLDEHNEYCISIEPNTTAPRGGKKCQITDFALWMEAWNNYLMTLVHHLPTRARELIGYQYIISNVARKQPFSVVMDYDTYFVVEEPNAYVGQSHTLLPMLVGYGGGRTLGEKWAQTAYYQAASN